jgi:hypothetical protein
MKEDMRRHFGHQGCGECLSESVTRLCKAKCDKFCHYVEPGATEMRDEWNSEEYLFVASWRKCSFGKVLLLMMSMMYEKATLLL